MSILIRGMEMPKNCDECRIMTYEDTNCISVHELFCGCPIVFRAHPQHEGNRPDYCPLIDVPPHGDLISREWLIDIALHLMNIAKNDDIADGVKWLWQYIIEAPTIIEAEGDYACSSCRFNPPSSCDGKPCTMCDTSNPLTNCYQKAEGEDD